MGKFQETYYLQFGKRPDANDLTAIFSVRLDESGTDGRSEYVVVAGGVAPAGLWDKLESKWNSLLKRRNVSLFHTKEFKDRAGDFEGWGDLKCKNFVKSQEKIIKTTIPFTIAAAIERSTHAEVKNKMKGIRNFKADSDFGLCFRAIRFLACDRVAKLNPGSQAQFIVESGPFAADAGVIYEDVRKTKGAKYRPAMYAEMLAGFAHVPKGVLRSLEAADYLAGRALLDLEDGSYLSTKRANQVSLLMDREFLLQWYEDMLKEREHRRSFARKKANGGLASSASEEQSS